MTRPPAPSPSSPAFDPANAARSALEGGAPIVLLTGRAGTGKSYFIRGLTRSQPIPTALLAPTGLAAMNIGGQTVHSFFGFPPRPLIGLSEKPSWFFTQTARRLKRLIIDEVSMLRADVLDAMDSHLRTARRSQKPFGGVQMLLVGDFYQLPPVVRGDEGRMLEEAGYPSPFAFSAHVLRNHDVARFDLETVHRQTDQDFIDMLSAIRERRGVADALDALNATCLNQPSPAQPPILLAGTNAVADNYNARGLAALAGPQAVFAGGFKGEPPKTQSPDRWPAPMSLPLKIGARVIFTQNDSQARWVNGSLGEVTAFAEEVVEVRIDASGETVEVGRATWPQARWQWNENAQALEVKEEFRYVQFPLAPAWALTIHKAQGMTLDSVMIDLGRGAFAPGQTYVALSRARSLSGLRLARALAPRDVQVDPAIAEGLARFS
jgi:ATP-dependent DNA helicase PIF1